MEPVEYVFTLHDLSNLCSEVGINFYEIKKQYDTTQAGLDTPITIGDIAQHSGPGLAWIFMRKLPISAELEVLKAIIQIFKRNDEYHRIKKTLDLRITLPIEDTGHMFCSVAEAAQKCVDVYSDDQDAMKKELDQQVADICSVFPPLDTRKKNCMIKNLKDQVREVFYREALSRHKTNWFLKKIGLKRRDGQYFEFKWGTFKRKTWGLKFKITEFDKDHDYDNLWSVTFVFIYGYVSIHLPQWFPKHHFDDEMQGGIRQWGFDFTNDLEGTFEYLVLSWGKKTKFINLPWTLRGCIRHEILMKDGTWQTPPKWDSENPTRQEFDSQIAREYHEYKYVTNDGTIQNGTATIQVSEMEWRPWWTKKISIFRHIRRTVDVLFSNEVGEKAGSWKGGCIGRSIELKYEELPSEAFRRLMKKRDF